MTVHILKYLRGSQPLLNLACIERTVGMPANTLREAVSKRKPLPEKWNEPLEKWFDGFGKIIEWLLHDAKPELQLVSLGLHRSLPDQKGIHREWLLLWEQIEIWYGDVEKREDARELLVRLQKTFKISRT